jgi:hypothetical protein
MRRIDFIQQNSGVIRISCPNGAYEQEYRSKVLVLEISTFLDGFIKCWAVQKRHIEVVAFEVKINTVQGEVKVWKSVFRRCSGLRPLFPLKDVSDT